MFYLLLFSLYMHWFFNVQAVKFICRSNLKHSFASLGLKVLMPTRVGGTRWVGHLLRALKNFIASYPALRQHLEQVSLLLYLHFITWITIWLYKNFNCNCIWKLSGSQSNRANHQQHGRESQRTAKADEAKRCHYVRPSDGRCSVSAFSTFTDISRKELFSSRYSY